MRQHWSAGHVLPLDEGTAALENRIKLRTEGPRPVERARTPTGSSTASAATAGASGEPALGGGADRPVPYYSWRAASRYESGAHVREKPVNGTIVEMSSAATEVAANEFLIDFDMAEVAADSHIQAPLLVVQEPAY